MWNSVFQAEHSQGPRSISRYPESDQRAPTSAVPLDGLQIALMVSVLCFVWRLQDLLPIMARLQVPSLSIGLATVFFVLDRDPRRSARVWRLPVAKLALVLLACMLISVPFSLYPSNSLGFIWGDHLKTLLLFGLLLASLRSFDDLLRFAWVQVAGAALYSALILFRFDIGPGGRLGNLYYYDANDLCLLLVCTLPLAIYFAQRRGTVTRLLAVLATVIMLVAITKTGSRGGFLGLLAAVMAILFTFRHISRRVRVGSIALVMMGLSVVASDQYWDLMSTLLQPTEDYNWAGQQETGRMEVWKRGMGYMASHPFTGVGVRQFSRAEGTISPLVEDRAKLSGPQWRYFTAPHNIFVQIGAEVGVLGLFVFVGLLLKSYRLVNPGRKDHRIERVCGQDAVTLGHALGAGFFGFVVAGFFLSHAYMAFLYVMVALAGAYGKVTSGVLASTAGARTLRIRPSSLARGSRQSAW